MRPNASVRCDQSANCSYATWVATCNRELPNADWQSPKRWHQLWQVIHPYRCLQSVRRFLADSTLRLTPDPVHRIQNNPPKAQICHAICCLLKSKSTAQQSAPTAGSQGKANHTLNGSLRQGKPLPRASRPILPGPTGDLSRYCKSRSP